MKLVIQRVKRAKVSVDGNTVGKISEGLFVLLGVGEADDEKVTKTLADKLSKLRVMSDKNDKMNLSIRDVDAEILVVSQFTLYADTSAGNRPSFIKAANPKKAKELYNYFVDTLNKLGIKVETGVFGTYMNIKAELDGPVTIILET